MTRAPGSGHKFAHRRLQGLEIGLRAGAGQLIAWIRDDRLKPVLHGIFRLPDVHRAEEYFVNRRSDYLGRIVILPDTQRPAHGKAFAITARAG